VRYMADMAAEKDDRISLDVTCFVILLNLRKR
jgi:hypothetical protein